MDASSLTLQWLPLSTNQKAVITQAIQSQRLNLETKAILAMMLLYDSVNSTLLCTAFDIDCAAHMTS